LFLHPSGLFLLSASFNSLLQYLKSLSRSFCQFHAEFHANTLLFKIIQVSTYRNFKSQDSGSLYHM
jgi:hypothetical protein